MKSSRPLLFQLFPLFLLLSVLSVILLGMLSTRTISDYAQTSVLNNLLSNAQIIRHHISGYDLNDPDLKPDILKIHSETGIRITLINPGGKVIIDTNEDPGKMDNHGDRPEIIEAFKGGTGSITRYSFTIETPMLYVAIPIYQNDAITSVVRTSIALSDVQALNNQLKNRIWISAVIIVLFSALLSYIFSKRITIPLKRMIAGASRYSHEDFSEKIPAHNTEEIGGLAESLNNMAEQLHDRIEIVRNQRNELEAVLTSMIEGVLAVDLTHRIIRINSTAKDLLDIQEDMTDHVPVHEAIRHSELLTFIEDVLNSDETLETDLIVHRERDYFLQVTGTPLIGNNDEKLGALFVLNDISRIRKLEQIRSDFVANVSHELKTPITSIQGFVETLKDGAIHDTDNAGKFVDIIDRQSTRLGAIIDDLLQLSRIEREYDEGIIELEKASILPLLKSAVRDFETKSKGKKIAVQVDCTDDIKATINLRLMQNAINNLVDNAIKYSDSNKTVTLSAWQTASHVFIKVKDEGNGIASEHLPRLYERFYRVDKGRSRAMGGTGLGLAIVKHIVLAHQGKISVESQMNEGSEFIISLPV